MAKVLDFIRNSGEIGESVGEIKEYMERVVEENKALKIIVESQRSDLEKQGATIVAIFDMMNVLSTDIREVQDLLKVSNRTTEEIKHVKFYGQEMRILDQAREAVKGIRGTTVRSLIHRAARSSGNKNGEGYTLIYNKLLELTGFNVYDIGKITLKKSDGIDGWKKDPSYINAILREGFGEEAAIVCKQILADK